MMIVVLNSRQGVADDVVQFSSYHQYVWQTQVIEYLLDGWLMIKIWWLEDFVHLYAVLGQSNYRAATASLYLMDSSVIISVCGR